MKLIYITNSAQIAAHAERCGVDRIMVDLEILGKDERQIGRDTLVSRHVIEDVVHVRSAVQLAQLVVRIDPINAETEQQVKAVIAAGADAVMLPMFRTVAEVRFFMSLIGNQVAPILLWETAEAVERAEEILEECPGVYAHIGLNDLHLAYGCKFMFELLANGVVDELAKRFSRHAIAFGIGGISRLGQGTLDSRLILSEHVRLGSSGAILSRDFHGRATELLELTSRLDLEAEITAIRQYVREMRNAAPEVLRVNRARLQACVSQIVETQAKRFEERS